MSKQIPQKINNALKKGDLITHEQIFNGYSAKERKEILERSRYLLAAIELRKLRKKMKFSQDELARKMHVKREFVARIESGRQNITLETLYRIADAAGKEVHVRFR